MTSFDSATSENVFAASMTSQMFRNTLLPEPSIDKGSDDSGTPDGSTSAISYEPLKDPESESSSINFSESLHSLNSCSSDANQTLLAKEGEGEPGDSDDNDVTKVNEELLSSPRSFKTQGSDSSSNANRVASSADLEVAIAPMADKEDLVESDSYLSSGTFSESVSLSGEDQGQIKIHHHPASPHASVSSEADLQGFGIDDGSTSKIALDGQSIDSHMFTMLDQEMKSTTTLPDSDILERSETSPNASDEGLKVRFEGE